MNVDQKSYGEQSITDDSDNVIKSCDQEITKAREILEQKENMMKKALRNLSNKAQPAVRTLSDR